ncbi:MAG: hypothetical protein ABJP70_04470 [Erythrobacter sp.]
MFSKSWVAIVGVAILAVCATPSSAQRPIEIDIGASWEHPHSNITIPAELGGLARGASTEFAPDFLNIGFSFVKNEPYEEVSLYIYRHSSAGIPVWFEQARTAIEIRDLYQGPKLAFGIEQYGWPGADGLQGQRAIYATPDSSISSSTGVALFSVNGWLVKMRASSTTRTPEQLAELMDQAFSELTPPVVSTPQAPVKAVVDCEERLKFKKAKDAKQESGASVLAALLGGIVADDVNEEDAETTEPKPVVAWCRDSTLSPMQVAYRADASLESYLIALGDSGRSVSVAPDLNAMLLAEDPEKAKKTYSITVITDDRRINFVPQNRLPSPKRVFEVLQENRVIGSVSTWGDNRSININSDAL